MSQQTFVNYHPNAHVPVLDGVRGLAVSLVLAFHFFGFNFGWLGVDLFFVLSGFLITGILIDAKDKPSYFKNFYAKRTLRIFPLYYLVLIIFFIIVALKGASLHLSNYHYFLDNATWFFTYTQNWLWSFNNWPPDKGMDHLWSLAIEEQFYLFWPLLVYVIPARKLIYASLALIVIAIATRYVTYYQGLAIPFQYVNTICRLDSLSIGACIAILIRSNPKRLIQLVKIILVGVIPLTLYVCYKAQSFRYDDYHYLTIGFTLFDIVCGVLLVASLTNWIPLMSRFFSSSIMCWLGRYSYGLYVYHWIIYAWLLQFMKSIINAHLTIMPGWISYGVICLMATLVVSKISYDYFEARLLKLKKRFEK